MPSPRISAGWRSASTRSPRSRAVFIGLILGGLLGRIEWRLVFVVSVPFGLFGTVWAYLKLHDTGDRAPASIDWWGNVTFAVGLVLVLVAITYGIEPYGHRAMGWTSPKVLGELIAGIVILGMFAVDRDEGHRIRCSDAAVPDPGLQRRATSPACSPRSAAAGCCSCSSSGCRGSGCRCTATASP